MLINAHEIHIHNHHRFLVLEIDCGWIIMKYLFSYIVVIVINEIIEE